MLFAGTLAKAYIFFMYFDRTKKLYNLFINLIYSFMKKILLSILCLFSIIAVRAEEVTFDFTAQGYSNAQEITSVTINSDITALFDKGTNSNTCKYYNTGTAVRVYGGGTMTLTATDGYTINSVSFVTNSYNPVNEESTVSAGTLTIESTTAATISDINAGAITFTQGGTKGHVRIQQMTITYTAAATNAISKPTASVAAGTIYNPTTVELSGEGTIYYTIDGTEPTTASAVYSEAIAISKWGETTTIKAIAVNGDESSEVATFAYDLKVAAPVFSIKGGVSTKITGATALTFTCETEGATIYYNNRGKSPIDEGSKVWGSLSVLTSSTVKAVAYVVNENGEKVYSDIAEESYIITTVEPFKAANTITSGKQYLIACEGKTAIPFSAEKTYGYMSSSDVTVNGEFIETFKYYGFTFTETETEGEYTIMGADGRYLYLSINEKGTYYSSFNLTDDITELGDAAIWAIEISEDDFTAAITNKAAGYSIQYSTNYKNFEAKAEATILPVLYELGAYPTIEITPATWETVPSITTITVTCESGIALNESDDLYATYRNDNYETFDLGYGVVSADGKSVVYELETAIEANGTYNFIFPAGLFTLDPNGLATASESKTIYVTVDNPNVLEIVYSTPGNYSTLNSIEYLYFEFSQDIFEGGSISEAVLTDEEGNEYPLSVTYTDSWGDPTPYNSLCLKTAEPITTPGTYTFELKKDYVYAGTDTKISYDVTYVYTIKEALKMTNISPVAGTELTSIDEFIVEFNQDISFYGEAFFGYGPNYEEVFFMASLYDKDGNELPYNMIRLVPSEPITAAGEYTIFISDIYVMGTWNDSFNTMYTFEFNGSSITSGIDGVEAEKNEEVIYDITGRQVKEINKAGIYIINGKKVIIK